MSLAQVWLQADIWLAFLVLTAGSLIVMPLGHLVETRLPSRLLQWQWEHVGMALLRILLLLLFIVLASPSLYGLESAPATSEILAAESGRPQMLINLLFVLAVLLSLIPVIGDWHGLTLPLQGMAAVALIFNWMPAQQIPPAAYWPGWLLVLLLVGLAWLTHEIALRLGEYCGHAVDRKWKVSGSHELCGNVLLLVLQTPIIVIYAHYLGNQV